MAAPQSHHQAEGQTRSWFLEIELSAAVRRHPAIQLLVRTSPRGLQSARSRDKSLTLQIASQFPAQLCRLPDEKSRTDESGRFEFEDLNPGAYRVKITSKGFSEDEQSISIRAGATSRGQFALKPLDDSKRMVRVVPESPRIATAVRFGQVRGRVVDAASSAPIAGAVVVVTGQQRAVTGRDGSYNLNSLPPGSDEVTISRVGFAEKRTIFTIRAGEVTDASFRLTAVTRRPSK